MAQRLLMKVRVQSVRDESATVRSLTLIPEDRPGFPPVPGGASTILRLPSGTRRNYSLFGENTENEWCIAVKLEENGRGGSREVFADIARGDVLWASYPQDGPTIPESAHRVVFVAGGIGITAILAQLRSLPESTARVVHYSSRDDQPPLLSELRELAGVVTLHNSADGTRLHLPSLIETMAEDEHLYVCGPPSMLEELGACGPILPKDRLHVESFGLATGPSVGEPFEVELIAKRETFTVDANTSLLHALHQHGVTVDASCEGGICGSCVVQYVEGSPIHRDSCLSPEVRRDLLTACVSRAEGRLKLLL